MPGQGNPGTLKRLVYGIRRRLLLYDSFQDPKTIADLKCFYGHNNSPWLRLAPFQVEENSKDPHHVTIRNLLFDNECDNITEFLGPFLDFPPGRMNFRSAKNDWTMKKYLFSRLF